MRRLWLAAALCAWRSAPAAAAGDAVGLLRAEFERTKAELEALDAPMDRVSGAALDGRDFDRTWLEAVDLARRLETRSDRLAGILADLDSTGVSSREARGLRRDIRAFQTREIVRLNLFFVVPRQEHLDREAGERRFWAYGLAAGVLAALWARFGLWACLLCLWAVPARAQSPFESGLEQLRRELRGIEGRPEPACERMVACADAYFSGSGVALCERSIGYDQLRYYRRDKRLVALAGDARRLRVAAGGGTQRIVAGILQRDISASRSKMQLGVQRTLDAREAWRNSRRRRMGMVAAFVAAAALCTLLYRFRTGAMAAVFLLLISGPASAREPRAEFERAKAEAAPLLGRMEEAIDGAHASGPEEVEYQELVAKVSVSAQGLLALQEDVQRTPRAGLPMDQAVRLNVLERDIDQCLTSLQDAAYYMVTFHQDAVSAARRRRYWAAGLVVAGAVLLGIISRHGLRLLPFHRAGSEIRGS